MTPLEYVVPSTHKEAFSVYGRMVLDCDPTKWESRTTEENAIWLIGRLKELLRERPVRVEVEHPEPILPDVTWDARLRPYVIEQKPVTVRLVSDDGRIYTLSPSPVWIST